MILLSPWLFRFWKSEKQQNALFSTSSIVITFTQGQHLRQNEMWRNISKEQEWKGPSPFYSLKLWRKWNWINLWAESCASNAGCRGPRWGEVEVWTPVIRLWQWVHGLQSLGLGIKMLHTIGKHSMSRELCSERLGEPRPDSDGRRLNWSNLQKLRKRACL